MKTVERSARLRAFESSHDLAVLPGLYMVARVDGRGFTRLVRELHPFEAPFDVAFRDHMIATATHLMDCGFDARFGYAQSDEISILIDRDDDCFGRRLAKLNSVIAGEASALFSSRLGVPAAFDCRISQLPSERDVIDYFRWRQDDAARNALNAHCYWLLRGQGETPQAVTQRLRGLDVAAKNELLFQGARINFNDLPNWQRRGVGIVWNIHRHEGRNPLTGAVTEATRRRLGVDTELPMKEEFERYVASAMRA